MKKCYTINFRIPVKRFWTIVVPLLFLVPLAGAFAGFLVVDRVVMPRVVGISDRGTVEVPDVSGMPREEARRKLYADGLRLQVGRKEYSNEVARDAVISQQPEPGTLVKRSRYITAVISEGSEVDTIPDVRNLSERRTRNSLRERGFSDLKIVSTYNEKYPKDVIIGTEPPAGTVTSREVRVEAYLSKGPRPTHAEVPNVVGDMLSEAKAKIAESGLVLGDVQYQSSGAGGAGRVVSQSTSPGTRIPLDTPVKLVVSSR